MRRLLIAAFIFFTAPAFYATVSAADDWGTNTPGVVLTLIETGRSPDGGATKIAYRLTASGLPPDKTYRLSVRPFLGKVMHVDIDWTVNPAGELTTKNGIPLSKVDLSATHYVLGEPYDVSLESTDGAVKGYASAVPFPVTAKDGACSGEMSLVTLTSMGFFMQGFDPGEALTVTDDSAGEVMNRASSADPQGKLAIVEYPAVKGKRGGPATLKVAGKHCTLTFTYAWGDGLTVL